MKAKTILVVDDKIENRELISFHLIQNGYQVIKAESGHAALEAIRLENPDLVLLDIKMPGMDGIETLKKIKTMAHSIPVAMVTAVWDENEAKKAMEAGAFEYITKPIDFEYLKLAILTKIIP